MLTKSLSCNEIWTKQVVPECVSQPHNDTDSALDASKRHRSSDKLTKTKTENHKTVIYFGDSISSKKQHNQLQQQMKTQQISANRMNGNDMTEERSDLRHAQRLCDEMVYKRQQSVRMQSKNNEVHSKCATEEAVTVVNDVKLMKNEPVNLVKHLKTVLEEKCQLKNDKTAIVVESKTDESDKNLNNSKDINNGSDANTSKVEVGKKLPPFIESIVNGVINIKIDESFDAATKLVRSIESPESDDTNSFDAIEDGNDLFLDVGGEVNNLYGVMDWSYVQEWRTR